MMRPETRRDADHRFYDDDAVDTVAKRQPFRNFRLLTQIGFATAMVAGLTIAALEKPRAPDVARAWENPPVAHSGIRTAVSELGVAPLLRLEPNAGDWPAQAEAPRWNPSTGLREDALAGGSFDTIEAPFLRLTLAEAATASTAPASLFVTLARRAAEIEGLAVLRTGLRGQIDTKFGPFEIVETVLSGHGIRACTGFQSRSVQNLQLDGWLCGILGQQPDTSSVACAIDRLALNGPAGPVLEAAFAEAQNHRIGGCGPSSDRSAEVTGSVSKTVVGSQPRKNEAQLRRIVQAGPQAGNNGRAKTSSP